jgi:hypothetical protein
MERRGTRGEQDGLTLGDCGEPLGLRPEDLDFQIPDSKIRVRIQNSKFRIINYY